MLKILYSYTDEFDQKSTQIKTLTEDTLEATNAMSLLVEEFEKFIVSKGFNENVF